MKRNRLMTDDREPVDGHRDFNWDPHLPDAPEGFPKGAKFDLARAEAKYLQDRITQSHDKSLLAVMINAQSFYEGDYFWNNASLINELLQPLKDIVGYSHNFAQTMHGAVLLYNLMLAQAQKNDELIEDYTESIKAWADDMKSLWNNLSDWYSDISTFWNCNAFQYANIPYPTKQFVEMWCKLVFEKSLIDKIAVSIEAKELIRQREVRLKKQRARLENKRYLELWQGSSGIGMIDYRWRRVSRIIQDIRKGLDCEEAMNKRNA